MGVILREKKLKDGSVSLYLDIAHKRERKYEFLHIRISNKRKDLKDNQEKRKLAERIRSQREYELIIKESGLSDHKKRLADFIVFFDNVVHNEKKSHRLWICSVKHVQKYVGENGRLPFIEITEQWILDYQKHLLSLVSINSAFNYLNTFNIAMNIAVTQKIIRENPFKAIPKHQRLRRQEVERTFLTIEELNKMASTETEVHKQIKQVFFFACFTGLRWSDANQITWDDIDNVGKGKKESLVLRFKQQKTSSYEYLPLSEQATEIINERKADFKEFKKKKNMTFQDRQELDLGKTYIFPYVVEYNPNSRARQKNTNEQLKKWAKDAGIKKDIHFHVGRHTFATLALTYGTDLYTVSKLLGHRSINTTTIYAKVIDKLKNEAVAKLPIIGK